MFAELPLESSLGRAAQDARAAAPGAGPSAPPSAPAAADAAPEQEGPEAEDPEEEKRVLDQVLEVASGPEFIMEEGEEEAKDHDEAVDVS